MRRFINPLLLWLAHSSRADLIRQIQYLKAENEVLRGRLPKVIKTTAKERQLLLRYARPLGQVIYQLVSIVSPITIGQWLRRDRKPKPAKSNRKPGRPRTAKELEALIVKIAGETGWGYTRILGELKKLGVHAICRSTVVNILRRHGFDPSPHRKKATWDKFIKRHAETLWACDFMCRRVMTRKGWQFAWVLVFINVKSRKAWVSPSAIHSGVDWTAQQAKLFMEQHGGDTDRKLVVLHDRDSRYQRPFRSALSKAGGRAHVLPHCAPNLNAYVERFIQTLQQECLDHFMVFGTKHLDHLLKEYLEHYHEERPHQSLGNIPPAAVRPLRLAKSATGVIRCRSRLGGLLRHYERRAA